MNNKFATGKISIANEATIHRSTNDWVLHYQENNLLNDLQEASINLEYELYLANEKLNIVEMKDQTSYEIGSDVKMILQEVLRLTKRIPNEPSSYETKRAQQIAIAKDQVHRKLCAD